MLTKRRLLGRLVLCAAFTLAFLVPAVAEEEAEPKPKDARPKLGDRVGEVAGREGMWPAPTAEDWAKPCQIPFQRTWEDAIAVAKETGKPILICINMDGEIASEHWAGKRYRQPEVGKLYSQYVTVIASVYRHTPRDYDDEGQRILCPRFGSVTCGEHIAIEPTIFEKFCDGRRIAPRHIAVDVEGNEAYDAYYVNDTAGVFDSIIDGRAKFPEAKAPIVRGDRPILERVASRHLDDRKAVEKAYREGDAEMRKKLLEAAMKHKDAEQLELLRLAVFGLDPDMSKLARTALADTGSTRATTLISEALKVPMETGERDALIGALKRLGDGSPLARWLAGVHAGLATGSDSVDAKRWAEATKDGPPQAKPTKGGDALVTEAELRARTAYEKPKDPIAQLEVAESNLALALEAPRKYANDQRKARMFAEHLYRDAQAAAKEAEALGATGWRLHTVLALSAYYGGKVQESYGHAEKAMKDLPPGESSWSSMAVVTVFAESRWKAIKKAVRAGENWPPHWLGDLHAAYTVLMRHPLGTDDQVVWHYEFLEWLGADNRATRVLREGIKRFTDSLVLHERLRKRTMKRRGPRGLEAIYGRMLEAQGESASLLTFAGYASVIAAEQHRRSRDFNQAQEAYARSIELYERAAKADEAYAAPSAHSIALSLAARARVAYQLNDDEGALKEMLASLARSPRSAGTRDGMGVTPGETAQMLHARLEALERAEEAAQLKAALDKVDPALLRPDIGLGPGGR